MSKGGAEYSEAAGCDGTQERIKLLAIIPPQTQELGCALGAVLEPVQHVEMVAANLPDAGSAPTMLLGLLAKLEPNLLLLCLNQEAIAYSEALFEVVRKKQPGLFTLVILERAEPQSLQRLVQLGAADFCLAPLRPEDLLPRIIRWSSPTVNRKNVSRQLEERLGLKHFLGESRVFLEEVAKIPKLANCDANVFVTGETGTGKEMCARAIHHLGPRAGCPFVPVNCGAIPSELVENELFGHDAGAFTGASESIRGLVSDAEGGTLFLDEVDSLPLQVQVKFLRFLQDQEYRPLGARKTCRADVRIIAASNVDLDSAVRSGRFRSDLFYRLNVLPLKLPPLRERREDIPMLARHFAAKYVREFGTPERELSRTALEKLQSYEWPGNVRELENIVERAMVLSDKGLVTGDDISLPARPELAQPDSFKALKAHAIAEFETSYIRQLLASNGGNISKAARAAKKNRRAFFQLMRKHGIVAPAAVAVH